MAKPAAALKEPATRGRNVAPGPGLGGPGIGDVGDKAKVAAAAAKASGATPQDQNSPDNEQAMNALRAENLAAKAELSEMKAAMREAELRQVILEAERRTDKVTHDNAMLQQKLALLTLANGAPERVRPPLCIRAGARSLRATPTLRRPWTVWAKRCTCWRGLVWP